MRDPEPSGHLPAGARLLRALAWLVGALPWRVLRGLAGMAARGAAHEGREYQVAATNLRLIAPAMGLAPEQNATDERIRAVIRGSWTSAFESLRVWTRRPAANLQLVREVHGAELLGAALASGRGLLIAAPHYGNWELLNQWLAQRMDLAALYAPPESPSVDAFLRDARARPGVRPVRADGSGVRQLLRQLQRGGAVGVLPDQQPKQGEGVFAPFFGRPALTMTLFGRLAARSGAALLMIAAERREHGGFAIRIEPLPETVRDADPVAAATALNAAIEALAQRDFRQYQWGYKRFSLTPSGLGRDNPYWPHCYPNRRQR